MGILMALNQKLLGVVLLLLTTVTWLTYCENLPGNLDVDVTVAGSVFCSRCRDLDSTPMFGSEIILLCPHPPGDGGGNRARDPLVPVSSVFSASDGSFHLSVDPTYKNILHRCAVAITPTSDSNCELPPHSGHTISLSTLASSIDDTGAHVYALESSFRVSCSSNSMPTNTAKRHLLRLSEDINAHADQNLGIVHEQQSDERRSSDSKNLEPKQQQQQADERRTSDRMHLDPKQQQQEADERRTGNRKYLDPKQQQQQAHECRTSDRKYLETQSNAGSGSAGTMIPPLIPTNSRRLFQTVTVPPIPKIPPIPQIPPMPKIPPIPQVPAVPPPSPSSKTPSPTSFRAM